MVENRKTTILIVDDSAVGRATVIQAIRSAPFSILEAVNGKEALDKASRLSPDLIVLDIHLPDIDGFEVCRRLKSDRRTASIPVLHLTANCLDVKNKIAGLEGGADGYLTHPVVPEELLATIRSLLRLRRAEEALRLSEEKYAKTFQCSPDAILLTSVPEGKIIELNERAVGLTGYAYEEIIGRTTVELGLWADSFARDEYIALLRRDGRVTDFQTRFRTKSGTLITALISGEILRLQTGSCFLSVVRDISEREKAEIAVRNSLREKEVLLKEIHHRVKNNMQVITSILNLQARQASDDRLREALMETQRRIRSMALVHEKLYQARDLARIDFVEYAESLAVHLFHSFLPDSQNVDLKIDMEPAAFDLNIANPLGLILNEVISNALKHAFPGGRKGELLLRLRRGEEDDFVLTVRDDGVGLSSDLDARTSGSFGMQIIRTLVEQLKAEFRFLREEGTSFELRFRPLRFASKPIPESNGNNTDRN